MQNLGMLRDMKQRDTHARVDDEARKHKVRAARDIIYNKNYAVDGEAVQALLKEQSLAPTAVSPTSMLIMPFIQKLTGVVERILSKAQQIWVQSVFHLCCGPYA